MTYQKSEWYKGLLFAEEQSAQGWRINSYDYPEQWIAWTFEDTPAKQTVFGEVEWIQGVLDFYKNRNHHTDVEFESLTAEFLQVIEDNFWEIVLK